MLYYFIVSLFLSPFLFRTWTSSIWNVSVHCFIAMCVYVYVCVCVSICVSVYRNPKYRYTHTQDMSQKEISRLNLFGKRRVIEMEVKVRLKDKMESIENIWKVDQMTSSIMTYTHTHTHQSKIHRIITTAKRSKTDGQTQVQDLRKYLNVVFKS